jgi:AraC-like DNA-binding protein
LNGSSPASILRSFLRFSIHGQAVVNVVAKKLGMSERTLERRLAEEGVSFSQVLQQLKATLALRYLEMTGIPISRIAWLLGFEEASSFSHACRRWIGKSPREFRRSCLIRETQQKS